MFSYYGSKSKIVDYYPPPKFDKIIEPFAGSARYSLKYWDRDVLLIDKYDVIIDVWKYLQNASERDINKLPRLKPKQSVNNFNISDVEKKFLGFIIVGGLESPRENASAFKGCMDQDKLLRNIGKKLHKIRHWKIINSSYLDIKNNESTWFIDPPYQFGGEHYKESNKNIDFNDLSEWCKSRNGHVIVCENTKADWMDFKPIVEMQGTIHKTTEAIWTNYPTSYGNNQLNIF